MTEKKNSFCSECGKPNYNVVNKIEYFYDDVEEELNKLELEMLYVDNEDVETIIGYNVKGKGGKRQLLKTPELIKEVEEKLKKLFPDKEPDFYMGEMAC